MFLRARLTRRLVLAFVFVALVPLGILAAFGPPLVRRHFATLARERIVGVNEALVRDLAARRESARLRLETLASAPELIRLLLAEDPGLALIDDLVERRSAADLGWLEVTNDSGTVLARGHDRGAFGFPVADDPLVAAALTGQSMAAVVALAPPDSGLALLAAAPVVFEGRVLGVVRGGDRLDRSFVTRVHTLSGAQIAVTTNDGRLLATSLPEGSAEAFARVAVTPPDSGRRVVAGDVPYRVAVLPLAGPSGATVGRLAVGVSEADLDRTLQSLLRLLGAAALIGLFVAVGVALVMAERLSRPVRALAHAAQRVAHGDLSVRLPAGPNDEVGDLMAAFNAMSVDLGQSRERLVRSERQSAWAQVARRLAHEIKNPLTPIVLAVEEVERARARGDADLDEAIARAARTTRSETQTIRQLVDEFSDFARSPTPRLEDVDVHELLDEASDLYAPSTITVERDYDPGGGTIAADPALLARAFGNLVKNACEAMAGAGTLTLSTRRELEAMVIACADSGPGVEAGDRDRIFAPYFTTKTEGTGLGLAIVRRVVEDHGGTLELSEPTDAGARFVVRLPTRPASHTAEA